ncbi:MAG TPA: IS110 family transposase [Candidatus Saccharimonadales bacterium]|nr:IS110 family transposase [Candidatus Saccharimonadales bacterium]
MEEKPNPAPEPRVIGLDSHPDTFTAAALKGSIPRTAGTEKLFNRTPISQLQSWAQKNTRPSDIIVLEASGNSFFIARSLQAVGRKAIVLESRHLGKLKEAHANNDKISAVRIAKAYLAGTAKEVWIPDPKTQERRDWFLAFKKVVKRTTQLHNRLESYLSDHGVREFPVETLLNEPAQTQLKAKREWTSRQWQVVAGLIMEMRHAEEQRAHWLSLMSQEVMEDPVLLSLMRIGGIRDIIAFAIGAIIGDISRFATPKKLVNYLGLSPAFNDSGEGEWTGGVRGQGRRDLKSLLIQGAQAVLKTKTPMGKWGQKLFRRKNQWSLAVVAVARKMAVAIWYLLNGKWTEVEEIDVKLEGKITKMLGHVGPAGFQALNKPRLQVRKEVKERLKGGRTYYLNRDKKMPSRKAAAGTEPALQGT